MANAESARGASRSYEDLWPSVAARLQAALSVRGVPAPLRDDVIQEAAARIWERWSSIDTESDLFPLAFTIARNLVTDRARERDSLELHEAAGRPSNEDPYEIATSRIELGRVLRALKTLTPRYRDLLLAEAGWTFDNAEEPGGVVTNMARMRARRRLRAALEKAGAAVVLPFRRLRARASGWGSSARVQMGQAVSGCALEVAIACVLTLMGSGLVEEILQAPRSSPRLRAATLASDDSGRRASHSGVRTRGSIPGAPARATAHAPSQRGGGEQGGLGLDPLKNLPAGKGQGQSSGSFGAWGYDEKGGGHVELGEDDLTWRHRHRYKNPRCVRKLADGEVTTDCSGGEPPRGWVEVGYGDKTQRIGYGD